MTGIGSVANDRLAVLGDHNIDAVTAAWELVRQHLATEDAWLARDHARHFASAFGGNASRHFIRAAGDRIFDAERHGNRWRWANGLRRAHRRANGSRCTNWFWSADWLGSTNWFTGWLTHWLTSCLGGTVASEQSSVGG